jgi:putative restriction endonuclease
MAPRRNWTRTEVIEALSLYCQIPFGQIGPAHYAIRDLASKLGRTPDAVALKLSNLASLDPDLQARGVVGMRHGASIDRLVWNEFFGHWDDLAEASPLAEIQASTPPVETSRSLRESATYETEKVGTRKERRGQAFFRNAVLAAYDGRCCVTGITRPELLRASHIIPWSVSSEKRLSPMNGLALNALHDAAFDSGLITLDEKCRLVLSSRLREHVPRRLFADFFARFEGTAVSEPVRFQPSEENLAYHRERIFHA